MSYYQINRENVFIDRVCDRCGARIDHPDSMLYLLLENRKGEMVYNIEICRECVAEIADWLSGLELTDPLESTGEELDDSIWG
jgi:ribosomal protein L40E